MKLLIVEDERWEREGLVALIDRKRFGIDAVLTAQDGVEGLEVIARERPDVVITDIRMPGLTGLEMLERAGRLMEGRVCVILSGYTEFAYAKQALRLGAADFLVKPVGERELCEVLERAAAALERMPRRGARPDAARLLSGQAGAQEVKRALGLCDLASLRAAALYGVAEGTPLPPCSLVQGQSALCLLRPQDSLPEGGFAAAGVARVNGDGDIEAAVHRAQRALESARFRQIGAPVIYCAASREQAGARALRRRMEKLALKQAAASLDEERVRQVLDEISARLMEEMDVDRARAAEEIASLLCGEGGEAPLATALSCAGTLKEMTGIAQKHLAGRMARARRELRESEAYVLRRVIALVEEDFGNPDLNLQSVARQVFLSPNYVGALFKKSTGLPFSDYLCRRRLMAAARLLLERGMRVSAVAEAVGIPNVSYFCVQFRGAYGVTPSSFRQGG